MKKEKIVRKQGNSWMTAKVGVFFLLVSDGFAVGALAIQHLIPSNLFWNVLANALIMGYLFFEPDNRILKFIFRK